MPDAEVPQLRAPNDGEPIPPVDPEDLKCRWNTKQQPLTREAAPAAQSQEADRVAVSHRFRMIRMATEGFNHGQLVAPWKHGEDLDDAVFRVAATFPMPPLCQHVYMVAGDERYGFDPNAFVQKLIEETRISHTWEPVPVRVSEGGFSYVSRRFSTRNQGPPDSPEALKKFMAGPSDQEAKHDARELVWAVWSKCQPNLRRPSPKHEHDIGVVAMLFADVAIDNIDLAREFVFKMSGGEGRLPRRSC